MYGAFDVVLYFVVIQLFWLLINLLLILSYLNMHFSSVSTRADTSSLPVPQTMFNGPEGEMLGQLVVTPEVVVSKINIMKKNNSPGVDGISPKILK